MYLTEQQRRCVEINALADSSDPFVAARLAKDLVKDRIIHIKGDSSFNGRPRVNHPEENIKAWSDSALTRYNERKAMINKDHEEIVKKLGLK